jgi:hypothetical protein
MQACCTRSAAVLAARIKWASVISLSYFVEQKMQVSFEQRLQSTEYKSSPRSRKDEEAARARDQILRQSVSVYASQRCTMSDYPMGK